jgi:hypothetical protein
MANDVVAMVPVPDDERDEEIFRAWEDGKGMQSLSRQFGLSVVQIEQALDRMLPPFNQTGQLRAFERELRRLEDLSSDFYALARKDKNPECAHLYARLNERICAMRGIGPASTRMDPLTVEVAQQPSSFEKIKNAINHVYMQQPQAQRDAFDLVREIGGERALELLRAGASNGSAPAPMDSIHTLSEEPKQEPAKRGSVG